MSVPAGIDRVGISRGGKALAVGAEEGIYGVVRELVISIIYETIANATYEYPYLSYENRSGNLHLHSHKELEMLCLIQGGIIVTIGTQNSTLFPAISA